MCIPVQRLQTNRLLQLLDGAGSVFRFRIFLRLRERAQGPLRDRMSELADGDRPGNRFGFTAFRQSQQQWRATGVNIAIFLEHRRFVRRRHDPYSIHAGGHMGELKVAVAHDRDSIDYDVALQTVELHQKVSGLHTLAAPDLSR